jgi:hypothetical protein
MADKDVSSLTAAGNLDGTELLVLKQGANSRKGLVSQIMDWIDGRVTRQLVKSLAGALVGLSTIEQEITVTGATTDTTTAIIPARSIVFAVLTRTTLAVTGATSYDAGVVGETNKFGAALGIALGSTNIGVIGPTAYYANTAVRLTANGSNFTGGKVRVTLVVMTFGAATG